MAIINCPDCGKEISNKALSCPNCGFPLLMDDLNSKKDKLTLNQKDFRKNKKTNPIIGIFIFILILLIVATIIISRNFSIKKEEAVQLTQQADSQKTATMKAIVEQTATMQAGVEQTATIQAVIEQTATQQAMDFEKIYQSNFLLAAKTIYFFTNDCRSSTSSVAWLWDLGIDQGKSVNTIIWEWVDAGYQTGLWNKRDKQRIEVDELLTTVTPPINEFETHYEELSKLYEYYIFFSEQEKSPTGSLITYNQALKDKGTQLDTTISKLSISFPELKSCITNIDNCAPEGYFD